jgi:hypothetical protein
MIMSNLTCVARWQQRIRLCEVHETSAGRSRLASRSLITGTNVHLFGVCNAQVFSRRPSCRHCCDPGAAQSNAGGTFTGLRVEGIVGGDRVQADGHEDGVVYGVGVGYDMQMGGAVVGIEAEASDSSADVCDKDVDVTRRPSLHRRQARPVRWRTGRSRGRHQHADLRKAGYTNARFGFDYDDGGNGSNDFGDGRISTESASAPASRRCLARTAS